jgi:hypothetical protein
VLDLPEAAILNFLSDEFDKQIGTREGPRNRNGVRIRAAEMLMKFELPATGAPAGRVPSGLPNPGVVPTRTPQSKPSGSGTRQGSP